MFSQDRACDSKSTVLSFRARFFFRLNIVLNGQLIQSRGLLSEGECFNCFMFLNGHFLALRNARRIMFQNPSNWAERIVYNAENGAI